MRHKLFISLALVLICLFRTHTAHAAEICDYYDLYARFIVSFGKDIQLGPSGPSSVSGISFIFPDGSTLKIFPGLSLYDLEYGDSSDPEDLTAIPDEERFISEYAKNGCSVGTDKIPGGTTVSCKDYEYSLFKAGSEDRVKMIVTIMYDFKSDQYKSLYEDIVKSFVILPFDDNMTFYEFSCYARDVYYHAQDAAYRKLADDYAIPDVVCGRYRVRGKLEKLLLPGKK